jgi:hypothetical protein
MRGLTLPLWFVATENSTTGFTRVGMLMVYLRQKNLGTEIVARVVSYTDLIVIVSDLHAAGQRTIPIDQSYSVEIEELLALAEKAADFRRNQCYNA